MSGCASRFAVCAPDADARSHSYRRTLNKKDQLDDELEQQRILKACHKRCAERTLKVLEQCGGIFIKLGQHLVRSLFSRQPCHVVTNNAIHRAP